MRRATVLPFAALLLAAVVPAQAQPRQPSGSWLSEVARSYRGWGRVDDELRWAPWLCRLPMPSRARVSRGGEQVHGRKVYFVYASDRASYLGTVQGRARPARGLTVVKEAFHPTVLAGAPDPFAHPDLPAPLGGEEPTPNPPALLGGASAPDRYRPTVGEDGAPVGIGAFGGLYVLRYLGRNAPDTDEGWTYGTIAPDGTVTSEGRVAQCMSCHTSAPHHRLFGL